MRRPDLARELRAPRPNPTPEMRPFWDGLARGELLLLRCRICGAWRWPVAGCREHPNEPYLGNLVWTRARGLGRVLVYSVQHLPIVPAFAVPYVYAIVELDEGPVMPTNLVCAPEDARVGLRVRMVVKTVGDADGGPAHIPVFEPADGTP
ncbi:MAG: OB-fold domain-containing protein [Armatimonadota bacterium]|nr:OB-fold domain-containing protein [Armatimonadota bacterium]